MTKKDSFFYFNPQFGFIILCIVSLVLGCAKGESIDNPDFVFGGEMNTPVDPNTPNLGGNSSSNTGGNQNPQTGAMMNPTGNQRPQLMRIGDKIVALGQLLEIQLYATDPDGDPIQYSLRSPLPPEAKFDKTIGLFTWTPLNVDSPRVLLTFEASDGNLKDQETIAIEVVNSEMIMDLPPEVELAGDQSLIVDQMWSYQVVATDPNNQALSYRLTGDIPADFNFDATSGSMSWIPTVDDIGTHSLNISISDGTHTVLLEINLIVNQVNPNQPSNQPPVFVDIPLQTVQVGESVILEIQAQDDGDGSQLIYSTQGMLPTGANFNPMLRQFIWSPRAEHANQSLLLFLR
jgi:hypothetical protein